MNELTTVHIYKLERGHSSFVDSFTVMDTFLAHISLVFITKYTRATVDTF